MIPLIKIRHGKVRSKASRLKQHVVALAWNPHRKEAEVRKIVLGEASLS